MTDDGQGSRSSAYGSADEAEVPGPPAPPTPRAVFKLEAPAPRPERSVAIEQCLRKLVDDLRAGQLEARLLEELRAGRERELGREARKASPPRRAVIVTPASGRFRSAARA